MEQSLLNSSWLLLQKIMWAQWCQSFLNRKSQKFGYFHILKFYKQFSFFGKTRSGQTKHSYQAMDSPKSPIFNFWLEYLLTCLAGIADRKATMHTLISPIALHETRCNIVWLNPFANVFIQHIFIEHLLYFWYYQAP